MQATSLIHLHSDPAANRITEFAEVATALALDVGTLVRRYEDLVGTAPHRHERDKRYLGGRSGVTGSGAWSNRREEHLAVALYNASRGGAAFALPDRRPLEMIDYQMPLKARRDDRGIGKIDLFAVADGRLPCVIELKVAGKRVRGDTPLRALLEGLTYCAIVEANIADIASEHRALTTCRPTLVVMAPDDYWAGYVDHPRSGAWLSAVRSLISSLGDTLGLEVHLLALLGARFEMGLGGTPARLIGDCRMVSIDEWLNSRVRGEGRLGSKNGELPRQAVPDSA